MTKQSIIGLITYIKGPQATPMLRRGVIKFLEISGLCPHHMGLGGPIGSTQEKIFSLRVLRKHK
jgi:hypothetical protein